MPDAPFVTLERLAQRIGQRLPSVNQCLPRIWSFVSPVGDPHIFKQETGTGPNTVLRTDKESDFTGFKITGTGLLDLNVIDHQ